MTLIYHGALAKSDRMHDGPHDGGAGPIWLSTENDTLERTPDDPQRICRWSDPESGAAAVAVAANVMGTRFSDGALVFELGTNAGLRLSNAIPDVSQVTVGVIFEATDMDTETLQTLRPLAGNDYLHVAEGAGNIRAEQDAGRRALIHPNTANAGAATLVLCSVSGKEVGLLANDGPHQIGQQDGGDFSGGADHFIGCRSERPGPRKKLGACRLTDVFVWAGEGLSGDDAAVANDLRRKRGHGA